MKTRVPPPHKNVALVLPYPNPLNICASEICASEAAACGLFCIAGSARYCGGPEI